jgi:hypothetical protein
MTSLAFTEPGDECPLCQCGTVEHVDGEARCMGECGAVAPVARRAVEVEDVSVEDSPASRVVPA